ncbi:hypothetical protein B9Z19DRAFT_1129384 [Tuber borchii]|uniref:Uncharacterized protein n=1 Tax=Tuber borchii TaxID=42251 RepID=A0A2T6ZMP2_TUBBO|nr:hypothetical protein B9Z19DRAFT_1129384 [Tuber borchii]
MLSQSDKRGNPENQGYGSNGMSPGERLAIVIAALTLLVAMIPLFKCPRFHRWMSLISPFFEKVLGIALPNPASTAVTTPEDPSTIPAPEIPLPRRVFIYNDYSNAHTIGTSSNTFLYSENGVTAEDDRMPQVDGSLVPKRPERAVTYPFP